MTQINFKSKSCILAMLLPSSMLSSVSSLYSSLFLTRSLRSATPPQPQNWVTTLATTSSPAWYRRTPTRPRPWWTSSRRWSGTTCPRSPQRATMERVAWRPSYRSPEKLVRASFAFVSFFEIQYVAAAHRCSDGGMKTFRLLGLGYDTWSLVLACNLRTISRTGQKPVV